jgi:hypothetical protein
MSLIYRDGLVGDSTIWAMAAPGESTETMRY